MSHTSRLSVSVQLGTRSSGLLAPNLAPRTRLTGARVLAEIGDDRTRFADALALKAYPDRAHHPRLWQEPGGPRNRSPFDRKTPTIFSDKS